MRIMFVIYCPQYNCMKENQLIRCFKCRHTGVAFLLLFYGASTAMKNGFRACKRRHERSKSAVETPDVVF